MPGTNRWDIKAIDYRLDKLAGIPLTAKAPELEFDKMEAKIDARIAQRRSQGKKRLADGSVRVYFYAWRGGPLLKDMEGCPLQPHEPEFHAAYAEACKAQAKVPNGTLSYLIKEHSRSSDFTSKSDKTKRAYVRFLTEIEDIFGDLSLEYIQSQRARGKFKQWRDTLAAPPHALPIMNPLTTIPLYMSLTNRMSAENKIKQAAKACIYAFSILATFLLLGKGIISLFGISMPSIRVAGGIIILILALRMIFSGSNPSSEVDSSAADIKKADMDYSFSPLAMPSLASPGSIAMVMGLGSQIPAGQMIMGHIHILIGIAIVASIAYITLAASKWIEKLLGKHGTQAISKIMGVLLTCIAVQFLASGIRDFYIDFSALTPAGTL